MDIELFNTKTEFSIIITSKTNYEITHFNSAQDLLFNGKIGGNLFSNIWNEIF